jgi:hypothetical protein
MMPLEPPSWTMKKQLTYITAASPAPSLPTPLSSCKLIEDYHINEQPTDYSFSEVELKKIA